MYESCLCVDICSSSCSLHSFLLIRSMELSSLLQDLHLHPGPSQTLPPITELLSQLQETLLSEPSSSETLRLIGRVETLFQTADPDWLFCSERSGWAELRASYSAAVAALVAAAALPLCEDDCSSLPAAAYRGVPCRARAVSSALTALLGAVGNRGAGTGLPVTLAPSVLVFAVTHVQVRVMKAFPPAFILTFHMSWFPLIRTSCGQTPPPGQRPGSCRRRSSGQEAGETPPTS